MPFSSYYAASKHALRGFFKSLRLELKSFSIKVSVVEPGIFKTNLNQASENAEPSIADYDAIRDKALAVVSDSIDKAPTPEPIAEVVVKILRSDNPRFSYRVGTDTIFLPILQFMSNRLFEWGAARKFRL
jgi:NAD(P)-dependent dehydrogenase (short-subunit alcohol dehydrogenase family)